MTTGLLPNIVSVLESRGYLAEPTTCPRRIAEALSELQRWAGLEQTGQLDLATLEELDAPRFCALPDVMPQRATVCKWPDNRIPYYVVHALPGLTLEKTWEAFDWAMALWAGAAHLVPSRAASISEARIVARVRRLDGPSGVLAQSELPCGGTTQVRQDYDSGEGWDREVIAKLVVAHEIGHALGLGHNPNKGSLMSAYYDAGITALQAWDVAEIVKLYGKPKFPTPDPTPAPTPAAGITINPAAKSASFPAGWRIEVRDG